MPWQAAQFSTNSAFPALALLRSILPNTSSGQLGGAKRSIKPSTAMSSATAAFDWNRPSAGVLEVRSMGMNTPIVSLMFRANGSLRCAPHCVHVAWEAFQRKGGLAGAMPGLQFWGIPGRIDVKRLTIKAAASIRPGPQGEGLTMVRT